MKCPNCGAMMRKRGRGHVCEYCETTVDPPPVAASSPFDVFRDSDGDGTPDLFEGEGTSKTFRSHSVTTSYTFNDVTYSNLDDMPPDVRAHFESATDMIEGLRAERAPARPPPPREPPPRRPRIRFVDDEPAPRDKRALLVGLAVAIVLGLLFFLLR